MGGTGEVSSRPGGAGGGTFCLGRVDSHRPWRLMYLTTTPGMRYSTLMPLRKNIRTLVELFMRVREVSVSIAGPLVVPSQRRRGRGKKRSGDSRDVVADELVDHVNVVAVKRQW